MEVFTNQAYQLKKKQNKKKTAEQHLERSQGEKSYSAKWSRFSAVLLGYI